MSASFGLTICTAISILISVSIGDGSYYPVVPELAADCGSELNAVLLQTACALLYGAAWAGASVIWQQENWSLLRQTLVHMAVCSAATFPVAYFLRWMEHSAVGILSYYGIFLAIYFLIWLLQYLAMKRRVEQLNRGVRENSRGQG